MTKKEFYFIYFHGENKIRLISTDIEYTILSKLYQEFYRTIPHNIYRPFLPKSFLEKEFETHDFKKEYSKYDLEKAFTYWLYSVSKQSIVSILNASYKQVYSLYKMMYISSKKKITYTPDELFSLNDVTNQLPKEITSILKDLDIDFKNTKETMQQDNIDTEMNEVICMLGTEKIEGKVQKDNIDKEKINEIDTNKCIDIVKSVDISGYHEGEIFKKRKLQMFPILFESLDDEPHDSLKISSKFNDLANGVFAVLYQNKDSMIYDTAIFKIENIKYFTKIQEAGLDEIQIKDILYLNKPENLVRELIDYKDIRSCLTDISKYIVNMYDIRKILQQKPCKGTFIKCFLEFMYSTYDFDVSSSISIDTMFADFKVFNETKMFRLPLNIIVDKPMFIKMIEFLNLPIIDNNIQYVKKNNNKSDCITFGIEAQLDSLLKTPYVVQKSHQIRSEPVVTTSTNSLGIWLQSSHLLPKNDDMYKWNDRKIIE